MDKRAILKRPIKGRVMFGDQEGPEIELPAGVEFDVVDIDTNERGTAIFLSVDVMLDASHITLEDLEIG